MRERLTRSGKKETGEKDDLLFFGGGSGGVSFDNDFDLGAFFEFHFVAVFIFEGIFDADLAVEMVGAFNGDFRFLGLTRVLDDLLNDAWLLGFGLLLHNPASVSTTISGESRSLAPKRYPCIAGNREEKVCNGGLGI
jgi:hypothetical protein